MSVPNIAEVVDVAYTEEGPGGEGVDGRVTPLQHVSSNSATKSATEAQQQANHTRSIQKPPLRSIMSKNSRYSLLRKNDRRAISKFDQKWHML